MRGPRTAMKSGPHLPQLEKALAWNEDPTQPKKINKLKKNEMQIKLQWATTTACQTGKDNKAGKCGEVVRVGRNSLCHTLINGGVSGYNFSEEQ